MSLHRLEVEPRDVAAEALGLLLDAPAPAPLAELRIDDGDGGVLVLGLLGASHVVTATRPGHLLTEQVSCDAVAGGGQKLPREHADAGYAMTSTTSRLPLEQLQALAAQLRQRARDSRRWVCGSFPGDASAVTALTGDPLPAGGWTWQTWHLYPGRDTGTDGVVVETRTRWQP